ncbi:Aryl hydrocarbon receptor [Liparis tanakae]|uniref:Aryl hydrocarbon receptor n=1 Tax=Liparis tanakae TaxID=230148 RepID=A0A4Z2G196_9TELE|nr:Aryl hydrocarbon receptor [Liparis tanakae]
MKTGESGLTVFRLLTKDSGWRWVQSNARLVYRSSRPDYIIATQRPLGDEEGGEHLRKRAMHLPFTFATGEAALYQTGGSFRGNGSESKKGKLDETGSDDLDPKSLLEALMSQDGSVAEPEAAFHGGLFGGRPGGGGVLGGSSSADSWHAAPGGETGRCDGRAGGDDPLLAALDSLSLDGVEPCSNSELFSALENLGLDAEDLELLLLDERRIQVEPGHAPMLADLLADNQILSYVHDSLERGTPGEGPPHSVSRQPQAAGPLRAAPGPQGQQDQHPLRLQLHQPGVQLTTNATPDPCRYQSSYQLQGDHRLQQPPPQSSALELDRLLGLAGPQLGLPSFESYGSFDSASLDSAHSKNCLLWGLSLFVLLTVTVNRRRSASGPISLTVGLQEQKQSHASSREHYVHSGHHMTFNSALPFLTWPPGVPVAPSCSPSLTQGSRVVREVRCVMLATSVRPEPEGARRSAGIRLAVGSSGSAPERPAPSALPTLHL